MVEKKTFYQLLTLHATFSDEDDIKELFEVNGDGGISIGKFVTLNYRR